MNTDYKLLHWLNTDYIKLVSNPYADILTNEEQRSNAYQEALNRGASEAVAASTALQALKTGHL